MPIIRDPLASASSLATNDAFLPTLVPSSRAPLESLPILSARQFTDTFRDVPSARTGCMDNTQAESTCVATHDLHSSMRDVGHDYDNAVGVRH